MKAAANPVCARAGRGQCSTCLLNPLQGVTPLRASVFLLQEEQILL